MCCALLEHTPTRLVRLGALLVLSGRFCPQQEQLQTAAVRRVSLEHLLPLVPHALRAQLAPLATPAPFRVKFARLVRLLSIALPVWTALPALLLHQDCFALRVLQDLSARADLRAARRAVKDRLRLTALYVSTVRQEHSQPSERRVALTVARERGQGQ